MEKSSSAGGWPDRKVLVTGADGFVGRWLVQSLADAGASVIALGRIGSSNGPGASLRRAVSRVRHVECDVTDFAGLQRLVAEHDVDTIYHLAAINLNSGSSISPYQIFETNLRGTYTVLETARVSGRRIGVIVASSREVDDCFARASDRPHHPYMVSKASAELIAKSYFQTASLPVVVVRSDNIYGGGDLNWNRLIPGTIRSVLRGENPVIRSHGLFERDYVYVEDAIAAYLEIGARLYEPAVQGNLFRLATGRRHSVLKVVNEIIAISGRTDLEAQVLKEVSEARIDASYEPRIEKEILGWSASVSMHEGLERALAWYRNFFSQTPP